MSQYSLLAIPPYQFLIPLHELKEVQLTPDISPIPQAPPYVLGLFPIRGKLCTLLCLSTLLRFKNTVHSFPKVIILDHRIGLFALEVMDIDIISFSEEPKPPPQNLPFSDWVSGMFTSPKGEFFILNFAPLQQLVES